MVTGLGQVDEARIRVYEVLAQGSSDAGLEISTGRHLDLPVAELSRLLALLGADGMQAFCLYLEHLEHVPGVDGDLTLGVPHFSARWLLAASLESAERTGTPPMSKNAATRGHQAVERSGLLHALANPSTAPGQGARGRTWRAILNPRLVMIRGGREDLEGFPRVLRGRPRKDPDESRARLSRKRADGAKDPESGNPAIREVAPVSRIGEKRQSGADVAPSTLVSAGSSGISSAETTSAVGVVPELLTTASGPGLLALVLVPALRRDRTMVAGRLRDLFNELPVGERSADVVTSLGLPGEQTRRPDVLIDLIAETMLGERDTASDLAALGVAGPPVLGKAELPERLVVGLLIGWGLRRVTSWGAWLYQATRPGWTPKPGPLLDRFLQQVRGLEPFPATVQAPELVLPVVPTPAGVSSGQAVGPGDGEPGLLAKETIQRYFAAARRKWPMFCREGSPQADDPVWRSRLVRMYLAAEDRQSELESTQEVGR